MKLRSNCGSVEFRFTGVRPDDCSVTVALTLSTGAGWSLDGAEFKHPAIARFAVERRVSRRLSSEDVALVAATLDTDGFWLLPIQEPEHGCCYDGPNWFIESRTSAGYHKVIRYNWVMPKDFNTVFRDASELPERDRATLAGLLIESLEGEPEPDVEAAWLAEIERRVAELDAGTVKVIPWEEVRRRLLDRLNARWFSSRCAR